MPPLKWQRLPVRDTGQGMNTDILEPDQGSPILAIQNGFIGPDGMPHPKMFSWQPSSGNNIAGTTEWGYGEGPPVNGDNDQPIDVNGNASAMRYCANNYPPKSYAIYRGVSLKSTDPSSVSSLAPDSIPAPGMLGLNIRMDRVGIYSSPFFGTTPTPLAVLVGGDYQINTRIPNGIPMRDIAAIGVLAKGTVQSLGPTAANGSTGIFVLFMSATNWFLTKLSGSAGGFAPNYKGIVDPVPDTAFTTTEIHRLQVWGGQDSVVGINNVLPPHASGGNGVYLAAQVCEMFQGRIVSGNVIMAPKYTVAGDIASAQGYVQKRTRLVWTILPGEYPSRGQYTTKSEGLTHLQWPWCVEENNYVDIDGIGSIYALCNMGDNQLFIIGSDGCARLTGYLSTAVADINSATYDARKIMRSPGGSGPGCAVVTSHGVFFTGNDTIYSYDGNSIQDILYGAARFSGVQFGSNCGIIDDDHVYFGNGPLLVYNHTRRKWSYMGNVGKTIGPSVRKGGYMAYNNIDTGNGPALCTTGGLKVQPPSRHIITGKDLGASPTASQGAGEDYWVVLRPFGSSGIPKRFRHINVNYGLTAPGDSPPPTVTVRALFGADKGWPNAQIVNEAPVIGTLPLTHPVPPNWNWLGEGSLPTKTVRISLDDNKIFDYFQDGTAEMGWPDSIGLFFKMVYNNPYYDSTFFKIYSVDVSYIERPGPGHVVMGAA